MTTTLRFRRGNGDTEWKGRRLKISDWRLRTFFEFPKRATGIDLIFRRVPIIVQANAIREMLFWLGDSQYFIVTERDNPTKIYSNRIYRRDGTCGLANEAIEVARFCSYGSRFLIPFHHHAVWLEY